MTEAQMTEAQMTDDEEGTAPLISVCIPTLGRSSLVERTLPSLLTDQRGIGEIIVGIHEDHLLPMGFPTDDPAVRTLRHRADSISQIRNLLASYAQHRWLYFIDDDDQVAPQALGALLDLCDSPSVVFVSGTVVSVDRATSQETLQEPEPLGPLFGDMEGCFLAGAFLLRRPVFEFVGGYDERLTFGENSEMAMRVGQYLTANDLQARATTQPVLRYYASGNAYREQAAEGAEIVLQKHHHIFEKDRALRGRWEAMAGVALYRQGNYGSARKHFLRSVSATPGDPHTWFRLVLSFFPPLAQRRWNRKSSTQVAPHQPGAPSVKALVGIDTLGPGGAEESTLTVAPFLVEHGIELAVLLHRSIAPQREAMISEAGVPLTVLQPRQGGLGRDQLRQLREVRRLLRATRPDVFHVTLFDSVLVGALAAVGTGIPVVATIANTPPAIRGWGRATARDTAGHRVKVELARQVERLLFRHFVARVHAVTPGVAQAASIAFGIPMSKISVVTRGRDQRRFHPASDQQRTEARQHFNLSDNQLVIAVLARHEPQKGLIDLVDAIAVLVQQRPDVRLLLAGRDGSETARILQQIAGHRLENHVKVLGDISDPERVLAAADIYVLASLREGTSGATIEAMAMAKPIVATAVEGLTGIVRHGENALVVPIGDHREMADALADLAEHPGKARRLAEAARVEYLTTYTVSKAAQALAELYVNVATQDRPPRVGRRR